MTNFARAIVSTLIAFFALTATAVAQTYHVEKPFAGKLSKGEPDFTGIPVAIEAPPKERERISDHFRALHATIIIEPTCDFPETIVCVRALSDSPTNTSSYAYSNAYGRNGGYSTSSSFSGQRKTVWLFVLIMPHNPTTGEGLAPITLAQWSYEATAGTSNDSSSSSGRGGGYSVQTGGTSDFRGSVKNAIGNDISALTQSKIMRVLNFPAWGTEGGWVRGSQQLLWNAFPQATQIPAKTETHSKKTASLKSEEPTPPPASLAATPHND